MTMNISGFRAPQFGARQVPQSLRRAAQNEKTGKIVKSATAPVAERPHPEMSTSKKVDIFLAMVRKNGAVAKDLLRFAEEKGILHVRVVRDTIADVEARNNRPKPDGLRAAVLKAGKFVRPTEVAHTDGKPTNVGNPRPKGPGGSNPGRTGGKKKKK